ncbi:MAG: response regulator [Elusimicrobia bacterium]|nr:response regulator [Elusimicrobiota bacterium]
MSSSVPLRLLIADQDPAFVKLFARRMAELTAWTVTVESCGAGAELLQRIYAEPFDLVFMDLGLTDIGGLDLLARLARTSLPLPVVALSSENEARPAVEAMKRGVLDHVMKEDFATMDLGGFLGRLTETFRLKRENAELHQIGQMKNDFLATISHELRTPLTSILGLSELLMAGRMGPVADKQADGLRKVIEQSQNLARLINQLLDVQDTMLERAQGDFRPVSLTEIVDRHVTSLRPLFEKKGIQLALFLPGEPFFVHGHGESLGKVMEQLLLNALKFTPSGGGVTVSLQGMPPQGALLSVQDTGQGIPKEALGFVFQKFFHADPSLTRTTGGLGLGLAYCQHVVESHGGRIWVESAGSGQGTCVHISLACLARKGFPPPVPARDHQLVLWVDDNPNMLELMEVGFASLPETVHLVTRQSGQAALEEARARPPDLIVLDLMMPDMNGLEVLSHLKADPATARIPVFVVTGYREAAQEAVAQGAVDSFLKPFRIPEILEKIREILRLPSSAQKL